MMLLIQLYNTVNLRQHLYILVLVRTKLLSDIVGTARGNKNHTNGPTIEDLGGGPL